MAALPDSLILPHGCLVHKGGSQSGLWTRSGQQRAKQHSRLKTNEQQEQKNISKSWENSGGCPPRKENIQQLVSTPLHPEVLEANSATLQQPHPMQWSVSSDSEPWSIFPVFPGQPRILVSQLSACVRLIYGSVILAHLEWMLTKGPKHPVSLFIVA